jgi:hypothetical protein
MPSEQLRSPEELKAKMDSRKTNALASQAGDALGQLYIRAAYGDDEAMRFLVERTSELAQLLEILEQYQPNKLRVLAAKRIWWPMRMSRACAAENEKAQTELDRTRLRLSKLRVGEEAVIRVKPRTDLENYWTRLALWVVTEVWNMTRPATHVFLHHAKQAGASPFRIPVQVSGTKLKGNYYRVPQGLSFNVLIVSDWERQSLKLTAPVMRANLANWQSVAAEFVREAFHVRPVLYKEALAKVGQADRTEGDRRNMALDRVRQALRSLAFSRSCI